MDNLKQNIQYLMRGYLTSKAWTAEEVTLRLNQIMDRFNDLNQESRKLASQADVEKFLDALTSEGFLIKDGDTYSRRSGYRRTQARAK